MVEKITEMHKPQRLRDLEDYECHLITLIRQGLDDKYSLFSDKEILIKLLELQVLVEKRMKDFGNE